MKRKEKPAQMRNEKLERERKKKGRAKKFLEVEGDYL